jgi:lysophospholipase L1-like esterase
MSAQPLLALTLPESKAAIMDDAQPTGGTRETRLGVLAFGDSITNGGGELQWGVALQSWALWLARGLGLDYTGLAQDGAFVSDVLAGQIPAHQRALAGRRVRYRVGCLYIGVNDVRSLDWDRVGFERDFRQALSYLDCCCDRVLAATAPLDLGRPRAGAKVRELNRAVTAVAAELSALVLDLSQFGARNQVMSDHVHPTAFGQIAIAERALAVLAADGMPVVVRPSTLAPFQTTRWRRLRGDATYTYRHVKVSLRSLAVVTRARLAGWI